MISTTLADRVVTARAHSSVAKLLVGLMLVLTLLMGSWVTMHSENESVQPAPTSELIVTDEPAAISAVTADGYAGETGNLGAALCVLGVACVLVLVALAWRAPSRTCRVERVARNVRELVAGPPSRNPVLGLTELRVSRT